MRFKIYYNEKSNKLDINCLRDTYTDIILPENADQHVYFPIPGDMQKDIKAYLMPILSEEEATEIEKIRQEIEALNLKRKDFIEALRVKYNPVIIEKCEEFRLQNSEWFI